MQLELDQLLDLKIMIIRIDRAHAHIDQRITHAGVLPVDQAEIPVRQEQEVVAHAVDMGQDLRPVQTVEAIVSRIAPNKAASSSKFHGSKSSIIIMFS